MSKKVVIADLYRTCPGYPSLWKGVADDGRFVYIRYRHGILSHGVGDAMSDAVQDSFGREDAHAWGSSDGEMSDEAMKGYLAGVFEFPEAIVEQYS